MRWSQLVCLLLLASCTIYSPELISYEYKVSLINDVEAEMVYESLTFYAHVDDEDGESDLYSLVINHEDSGLFWELIAGDWDRLERSGEIWVGSHSLIMPQGSPLPRGKYSIVLNDYYGHSVSEEFSLSEPAPEEVSFPELNIEDKDILTVTGDYEKYLLWGYDKDDNLLFSIPVENEFAIALSTQPPEAFVEQLNSLYVYTSAPQSYYGIQIGPYFLEEENE